jgi:hypothetical protein
MTSREFRIWLEGFLENTDLKDIKIREGYDSSYNYLTMLKTIVDKLETVNDDCDKIGTNHDFSYPIIERLKPTTPPNPFTITCETKKEE